MTDIIFIILVFAIIFWLFDYHNEGFASSHPKWNSASYGYKCVGDKSSLHKILDTTYEDDLKMRNIKCIGDNKPPTKCWVFNNTKNSWTCDDQVKGDCVKLLNGNVVCSDSADQSFMFKCDGNMDDPECKRLYDSYKINPSLLAQGFKCDYGNGTVPLQNNGNIISGYLSSDNKVLRAKTNVDCVDMLKNSPLGEEKVTCSDGKTGDKCVALFNKAGIYTWRDSGYDCLAIEGNRYVAKKHANNAGIDFASYDGVNPMDCIGKIDFPLEGTPKPIVCNSSTDANRMCPVAFRDLGLQQTTTTPANPPATPSANPPTPSTPATTNPPANPVIVPPSTPPSTSTNSSSSSSSANSGLSTTAIVWIVVVIVLVLLIGVGAFFMMRRGKNVNVGVENEWIEMGNMGQQQYPQEQQLGGFLLW